MESVFACFEEAVVVWGVGSARAAYIHSTLGWYYYILVD